MTAAIGKHAVGRGDRVRSQVRSKIAEVYPRGVRWEGDAPPPPTFWMHQLKAEDGADQKFCLDPARLRQQTLALLDKRG